MKIAVLGANKKLGQKIILAAEKSKISTVSIVDSFTDVVGDGAALRGGLGVVAADEALDGGDGVLRVGDGAVLSGLADDQLAVLLEGDDGRRGAVALCVDDDGGLAALEDGHCRVGGAQVDADNLAHDDHPFWRVGIRTCLQALVYPTKSQNTTWELIESAGFRLQFFVRNNKEGAFSAYESGDLYPWVQSESV